MLNKPLVSVIIPYYNTHTYIIRCLEFVKKQTYENIEIIVVDDGSDEFSKEVLKNNSHLFDKLITQENKGQSSARNLGIRYAKGNYIFVMDSDDYIAPSFIEKSFVNLETNENVKIVTSFVNIIYENSKAVSKYKPKGGSAEKMLLNNTAMGSSFFRKKDWEKAGGYDESMRKGFEDWEFYIRLINTSENGSVSVVPEYLFYYTKRSNSTTTRANKIKYELLKYIYTKHQNLYKVYFKDFIDFLLEKLKREEQEKLKMYNRIEYKIGSKILQPLRFLKQYFRNI